MAQLPLPDAYRSAIQNPRLCFADQELKNGQITRNRAGLPIVWSGQFAVVFKAQTAKGYRAVRCFTNQVADHQDRYFRLHQHINGKTLPMLVDFEYQNQGILVGGIWFPIIKMEWANGFSLDKMIEEFVQQGNTDGIKTIANQWLKIVENLRCGQIAHGDLQHENILVNGNGIHLVDYDGAFIPSLAGRPALEIGHPHYQHPKRTIADFNLSIDNFSAFVIYLSLKALSEEPGLWYSFHKDKHLIFLNTDFKSPKQSQLLLRLKCHSNTEIRELANKFEVFCSGAVTNVPALSDIVDTGGTSANWVATWQTTPKPPPSPPVAWKDSWKTMEPPTIKSPQPLPSPVIPSHTRPITPAPITILKPKPSPLYAPPQKDNWFTLANLSHKTPSSFWNTLFSACGIGAIGGFLWAQFVPYGYSPLLFLVTTIFYWSIAPITYVVTKRAGAVFIAQVIIMITPYLMGKFAWWEEQIWFTILSAFSLSIVFWLARNKKFTIVIPVSYTHLTLPTKRIV